MTHAEIEATLQAAFTQCEVADCPLSPQQQQILREAIKEYLGAPPILLASGTLAVDTNPLDELTIEQRQALLRFVREQDEPESSWKVKLLNDWLHKRESGAVQFIREDYGLQWLNRITPSHLAQYAEPFDGVAIKLKVGDHIEVCNSLWEWVQDTGPCSREWFLCTIIGVQELSDSSQCHTNCTVRFDNGKEYELQGIYEWNRYCWRWPEYIQK